MTTAKVGSLREASQTIRRFVVGELTADAQLLSDYLREHHGHLKVWRLPYGELRQLSLLVEDRDKVVVQKVRLQNQLRSTLGQYFPQAVKAFADITTQTALEFLSKFPTFSSTRGKG